ncbi:hypothetical protein LUQ84_001740 [Hamiltosporidium tvaerminnensis]|nr:hypothetical protein LUQ84_001740 [Hamiltosporidium tvaerminnensis]
MDRDSNRLEVFSDRTGLEGVSDSNGLEVVSNSIDNYKSVNINTNTLHLVITNTSILHPVNTNTTIFTIWNSFVLGDCKLSKILKYFKMVWNVDISMVKIRDTVVFCTFYDNERFKNYLENFISELCCKKEGDGIIYCGVECPFDIDGYNFPEVVVDFRREREKGGIRII